MPAGGSSAGTSLGAAISRWLGSGDYTVSRNSLVGKASTGIPMMHKDGQTIIVRHREFLTEVTGSTTFAVKGTFPINPGMKLTFPWASSIARSFQQYRIKGMVYHYVPTSGSIATASPSLGSVMLQTVYRATDAAPSSKVELLNEYWSSEVVPSDTLAHPIECNPMENPYNVQYVRSHDPPAGESRLLYDLGTTYLAVSGQQASNQVLGDLWVTYEIELLKPIITSDVITDDPFWAIHLDSPTEWFTGTLTNNEGNLTIGNSGTKLTFPDDLIGTVDLTFTVIGTGLVTTWATSPPLLTFVGCVSTPMVSTGTYRSCSGPASAGLEWIARYRFILNSKLETKSITVQNSLPTLFTAGTITSVSTELTVRND